MKYRAIIYGKNPRIEQMEHADLFWAIKETKQILKDDVAKYNKTTSAKIQVYSVELCKWIYWGRLKEEY